jgi:hypothetical protein
MHFGWDAERLLTVFLEKGKEQVYKVRNRITNNRISSFALNFCSICLGVWCKGPRCKEEGVSNRNLLLQRVSWFLFSPLPPLSLSLSLSVSLSLFSFWLYCSLLLLRLFRSLLSICFLLSFSQPLPHFFPLFFPSSCYDDCPMKESYAAACGHRFCNGCWSTYITMKIKEGQSRRINCMVRQKQFFPLWTLPVCSHSLPLPLISSRFLFLCLSRSTSSLTQYCSLGSQMQHHLR